MRFEFEEAHYAQCDALARFLAERAGPEWLRTFWDDGSRDLSRWSELARLGVLGLTVPDAMGGGGANVVEASLLIETLGRHAFPQPVAETIGVVAPLLVHHGGGALQRDWLTGIAHGDVVATLQDGWQGFAPWGAEAQLALVVHDAGVSLCHPPVGLAAAPDAMDPARRPARLVLSDEFARIEGEPAVAFARGLAKSTVAQFLLGLAAGVLERAVGYAKLREQFGRPIGSFQAIKHMLANAHVAVETARRSTWYAAWAIEHDAPDAAQAAAIAKGSAAEAAVEASYAGLQVHGAIGYTWACDLKLWMKRIHVLESQFGGAQSQWRELAAMTFDQQGNSA